MSSTDVRRRCQKKKNVRLPECGSGASQSDYQVRDDSGVGEDHL